MPTDEELLRQYVERLVCETCMYAEQCYGEPCLAPIQRDAQVDYLLGAGEVNEEQFISMYGLDGMIEEPRDDV